MGSFEYVQIKNRCFGYIYIGGKIKQCHFETLGLFDKIMRLLLYYETSRLKNQPVPWHMGLVRWAPVLIILYDYYADPISKN